MSLYAVRTDNGIEFDTISDSADVAKARFLQGCLGWRYEYPDRYPHGEAWERYEENGAEVVAVEVKEIDPAKETTSELRSQ